MQISFFRRPPLLKGMCPEPSALLSHCAIDFQFFTRLSAVRHASACKVSVGFRAPCVPITDPPSIARFRRLVREPPLIDDARFRIATHPRAPDSVPGLVRPPARKRYPHDLYSTPRTLARPHQPGCGAS
jgi:hypothetical protein